MAVLNPYRSVNVAENRGKGKLPSFSISRVVIILVLLVFTAVTFFIHEAYSGVHAVGGELGIAKLGLNRLRGHLAPALSSDADPPSKGDTKPTVTGEGKDSVDATLKDKGAAATVGEDAMKKKKMDEEAAKKKVPPVPFVDHDSAASHAKSEENVNEKQHAHRTIHKLDMTSKGVNEGSQESNKHPAIPGKVEEVKPVAPKSPPHELKTIEKGNPGAEQMAAARSTGAGGASAHLDEAPASVSAAKKRQDLQGEAEKKRAAADIPVAKANKQVQPPVVPSLPKKKPGAPVMDPHKAVLKVGDPKPHNVEPAARPPNPYDLSVSAKKAQAEKRAKREMKEREAMQHLTCDGTVDPFADLPIDGWEPPSSASVKDKQAWRRKVDAMMHKIKAEKKGGKALREFIDKEVDKLKIDRLDTFCEAFLKDREGK